MEQVPLELLDFSVLFWRLSLLLGQQERGEVGAKRVIQRWQYLLSPSSYQCTLVDKVHSWSVVDHLGSFLNKTRWRKIRISPWFPFKHCDCRSPVLYISSRIYVMHVYFNPALTCCISNYHIYASCWTCERFCMYVYNEMPNFFSAAFSAGFDRLQSLHFVKSWK